MSGITAAEILDHVARLVVELLSTTRTSQVTEFEGWPPRF